MLRSRVIFSPIREGASLSILHSLGSTTSVASLLKLFHVAEPTCSLLAVFPDISLSVVESVLFLFSGHLMITW